MQRIFSTVLLLLALCGTVAAQSSLSREDRAESFRLVWETVRDRYFDPAFGGVDWDTVRRELEPAAMSAPTDAAFYGVLQQMVDRLGQSHFRVMPPFWVSTQQRARMGSASAGIEVVAAGEDLLVWRLRSSVQEEAPGLRSGCALLKAGDTVFRDLREEVYRQHPDSHRAGTEFLEAASYALTGRYGERLAIHYRCGDEAPRESALTLRSFHSGERSEQIGHVPSLETEFEVRRLDGDVVVVRFNLFVMSLLPRIRAAIQQAAADGTAGIVFDVRGNPGGIGAMANGLAGYLVRERSSLGVMKLRGAELKFLAFPQDGAYLGPVAVLIDRGSASTSEIFAAGLQEMGRAVVVGERSMGAALPSLFTELPHGAMLQFAVADFLTPKGQRIEGKGVEPDVQAAMDAASLLAGSDPQLEAARLALLRKARQSAIVVTGF